MAYKNSINKILNYLDELDKEVLYFSPNFSRELKCNLKCGACCGAYTLDYLVGSKRWENFKTRYPEKVSLFKRREFKGAEYFSYEQDDHKNLYCSLLDRSNGACTIHDFNAFTCDFELIKLQGNGNYSRYGISLVQLIKKEYGRAWSMTRVTDGVKGEVLCEIKDFSEEVFLRDLELLKELQEHYIAHRKKREVKLDFLISYIENHIREIIKNRGCSELFITSNGFLTKEEVLKLKTIEKWW